MNQPICPQCQSPIPPDAPGGLCPSCLLLGAAIGTESAPAGMAHAPSLDEIRAAFPELEVLEMFGHGGMGVVFKARQPRLDRLVALKILPPALARQPGFAERFTREARALARLSHPHIVTVFDFGERAGFFYLLMEFVNGVNLRQAIRAGVKPEQALTLVPKICEALQFAHDHGVLHRDIKPENILLDVSGTPKLADFGIAKLAGEPGSAPDLTLTGASLGTAAYMAPEQIEHPAEVDHRADIYSLGVVLYEMLTGELPLGRFAAPSEKANVARGVDEVVFRALEKERGRRQQSATEMKTEVDHARNAGVGEGSPPPAGGRNAHSAPAATVGGGGLARTLALWGAWLNLVPLALAICFTPLWLKIYDLREAHARFPDALRPHMGALLGFAIPSGVALFVAFVFTIIVLFGFRFRAKWYFWWVLIYGAALTGLYGLGLVFVAFCLARRREFFPQFPNAPAPARRPRNPAANWIAAAVSLLFAFGVIFLMMRNAESAAGARRAQVDAAVAARLVDYADAEHLLARDKSPAAKQTLSAAERALNTARSEQFRTYGELANQRPILLAPAIGLAGFFFAGFFAVRAIFARPRPPRPPGYNPWPRRVFWLFVGFVVIPAILIVIALVLPSIATRTNQPPMRISNYQRASASAVVTPERAPFAAQLGSGTVELVAISMHPSADLPWWQMDGMAAKEGPFTEAGPRLFEGLGTRSYEFVFRTRDIPRGASAPVWEIEGFQSASGGGIPALRSNPAALLPGYLMIKASLPETLQRANIKIGWAYEEWHTLSENAPNNALGGNVEFGGLLWRITHGTGVETKAGELMITFNHNTDPGYEVRVAAMKKDGTEVGHARLSRIGEQSEWTFPGLSMAEVQSFRFQVRRYRWVEFRDIALSPIERRLEASSPNNATNALYEEGIQLARERLEAVRKRVDAGLGTPLDVGLAERELAIAEARGNRLAIAQARERYAAEHARDTALRFESGLASQQERDAVHQELNSARLELEKAREPDAAPATQP